MNANFNPYKAFFYEIFTNNELALMSPHYTQFEMVRARKIRNKDGGDSMSMMMLTLVTMTLKFQPGMAPEFARRAIKQKRGYPSEQKNTTLR